MKHTYMLAKRDHDHPESRQRIYREVPEPCPDFGLTFAELAQATVNYRTGGEVNQNDRDALLMLAEYRAHVWEVEAREIGKLTSYLNVYCALRDEATTDGHRRAANFFRHRLQHVYSCTIPDDIHPLHVHKYACQTVIDLTLLPLFIRRGEKPTDAYIERQSNNAISYNFPEYDT